MSSTHFGLLLKKKRKENKGMKKMNEIENNGKNEMEKNDKEK